MKLHFFFIAIIASSIGPYIGLGFRLEHPIIYILFFYLTILFIKGKKVNKHISILTLPLLISLIITVVFDLTTGPKIRVGNFFSNVDNLSQPVILIFIFSLLMDSSFNTEKFKKALMFFMKISIIAGITSILTIFFDFEFILKYFVSITDDEDNLWKQVLNLGRYTGLFSQPLEAGIFFTCSMLSIIYLNREYGFKGIKFKITFLIIFIAGTISLSKNFYLLGLFCSILFYGQLSKWSIMNYITLISSTLTIIVLVFLFIIDDVGNYLTSILDLYQTNGLASAVTAGRFGGKESTEVEILFNNFFNDGLLTGFGLGTHLPLDNGFLEYGYQGGIISLVGYIAFIIMGLLKSITIKKNPAGMFLKIIFIYVFLASVGGPVITANRANIIIIFLTCASLALSYKTSKAYV